MKSAGWYLMHGGKRLVADTMREARRLAQLVADETGKPVTVRALKPATRTAPKKATPKRKRVMRRNPDPASIMDVLVARQQIADQRRTYMAATKGRRLAKSLVRRGQASQLEARAAKSAKFAVDVANRRESYTLYRPSRSAADRLAGEFKAAGYNVKIREV